ncbi:MAG: transposase [Janthinobacterium lividum]
MVKVEGKSTFENGTKAAVTRNAYNLKVIIADGGYRGEIIDLVKNKFGYLLQIVMRSDRNIRFEPVHKRWVVERTFAWFDNDRRLCRNYELLMETSEEIVKLSAIKLLLNKI